MSRWGLWWSGNYVMQGWLGLPFFVAVISGDECAKWGFRLPLAGRDRRNSFQSALGLWRSI